MPNKSIRLRSVESPDIINVIEENTPRRRISTAMIEFSFFSGELVSGGKKLEDVVLSFL